MLIWIVYADFESAYSLHFWWLTKWYSVCDMWCEAFHTQFSHIMEKSQQNYVQLQLLFGL